MVNGENGEISLKIESCYTFTDYQIPFFYMEAKFGPLEKGIKTIDITGDEIFRTNSQIHPF
jgi:hypothetical protein